MTVLQHPRFITDDERLYGDTVVLRLVCEEDCNERYLAWLRDADVVRFLETRWCEQTLDTIRAHIEQMRASPADFLFAIHDGPNGPHVGNVKLGSINSEHLTGEVSYFIGERGAWGRGLATDAIKTCIRFGFERLGLHRIEAGVYGANAASIRALEKAGMIRDGRLRNRLRSGDLWDDHLLYGILRSEWPRP